ncbi:hypothetical protein NY08_767 [Rhodococcus sp. B7740]|nr:hypothetical protein NY08_767 [Rhodococcus sp. B7740]
MDPLGTVVLPREGRVTGRPVLRFASGFSLNETDSFAACDIDSRQ